MLIKINEFLAARGQATVMEMSQYFGISIEVLRGMLTHLVYKGRIVYEEVGCSKGCTSCSPEQLELYRWVGCLHNKIPCVNL